MISSRYADFKLFRSGCIISLLENYSKHSSHLIDLKTNLGNLSRFVVPSDESDAIRVPDFVCQEEKECLDRVVASIDKVSHEEVIRLRYISADFEEFFQVIKLSVNISTDRNRRVNPLNIPLFH